MLGVTIARGSKFRHASRIAVTRGVMRPSISPTHHGAVTAVVNHPGLEVVRAEVDERANRAPGPTTSAIASSLSPFCADTT